MEPTPHRPGQVRAVGRFGGGYPGKAHILGGANSCDEQLWVESEPWLCSGGGPEDVVGLRVWEVP